MGGAQPLAVTMNGGVAIVVEVDPAPHPTAGSRPATSTSSPTTSTTPSPGPRRPGPTGTRCRSACSATPPRCCPGWSEMDAPIDIVTDQTPAHDPLSYVPAGPVARRGRGAPSPRPRRLHRPGPGTRWPGTARRWSPSSTAGVEVFDYGNSLRREAQLGGFERAFDYPGFLPAYIRPLFCEGKGPFRWAALSGDPADIGATDKAVLDEFPDERGARPLDPPGVGPGGVPGAARPHLLARLRRARPDGPALQRARRQRAGCRRRS